MQVSNSTRFSENPTPSSITLFATSGDGRGPQLKSNLSTDSVSWGRKDESSGHEPGLNQATGVFSQKNNFADQVDALLNQLTSILKKLSELVGGPGDSANGAVNSNPPRGGEVDYGAVPKSGQSQTQNASNGSDSSSAKSVDAGSAYHGGANTVPDRIKSPDAARQMIRDVKNADGGTLRIQMSHDQISDPAQMNKLKALVDEGDKQGVKVQFTFRDNANGGGGNVLSGDKLHQASEDVKKVVSALGHHPSFVLDTFNEGGKSATAEWANMQATLIKAARDTGYKGDIVVEDSNWGGGLTAGGESGLVKYASMLNAANGSQSPGLIGSIHEYANGSDASSRLASEITALQRAGYKPQIGEVGNANWQGGSNFEQRDGANLAVKNNMAALEAAGADVLPWMDQFKNGKISHDVGFSKDDQF